MKTVDFKVRVIERLKNDAAFRQAYEREIRNTEAEGLADVAQSMRDTLAKAC